MGMQSRVLIFLLTVYLVSGTTKYDQGSNQKAAAGEDGGETTAMLDAMVQLMQGSPGEFDREFLASLTACWETLDPEMRLVSDGAWRGMVTYHDTDGAGTNDTWGSCLGNGHCHEYHEQNLTTQEYHNIGIYEPCNYASNTAYYHVVTSICLYEEWAVSAEYQVAMAQAFTGEYIYNKITWFLKSVIFKF